MKTRPRLLRAFWTLVLAGGVSAVAAAAEIPRLSDGVTRTSRPVRLLRTWEETVKVNGRDTPRRVRLVFDYSQGVAREETYDLRGILRGSRTFTQTMPAPSAEEIAEAFTLVRTDASLASVFSRFSVVLDGGFLLEEEPGKPCGPGTRCLHVFLLSSDRAGLIRRVVVDLASRTLAYSVYTPTNLGSHER